MLKLHLDIKGNGIPLILLHGWGWHSGIWDELLFDLQQKFQVFAIDLPGCGKSPLSSKNYSFEEIVPLLLEVTPANAIWLGWSLGGLFAYWIAIHHPEKISRLVIVSSSPCFIANENWPGVAATALDKFSNLLQADHHSTLLDFLELQLRGSHQRDAQLRHLKNKYQQYKCNQAALTGGLELLRNTDLRKELCNIQCPNLHIFGQRDTIVPVSIATHLSQWITGQIKIIKQTGHMPFLSHRTEFLNDLYSFLSTH